MALKAKRQSLACGRPHQPSPSPNEGMLAAQQPAGDVMKVLWTTEMVMSTPEGDANCSPGAGGRCAHLLPPLWG